MKCDNKIVKALWDSKYGNVFKTNISGAVLGAIIDPDGDGKVSLNDILLGIGGAHIWKAYRAGNLSTGLSMKIEHDFDVMSEAISKHPDILVPNELVHTFRDLMGSSGATEFIKFNPAQVKAMLMDSIDLQINGTTAKHIEFWKKYRMYIPPDFSYARILDISKSPELVTLLKENIKQSEIKLFGNHIDLDQKAMLSHGSATKQGEINQIELNIKDSVAQRYYSFIHENQHLNQPAHLGGTSSSLISTVQRNFPGDLPEDLRNINPYTIYRNNMGEAEAVYMEHLNIALIKQTNKQTLTRIDEALLKNHPMVHMLNETKGAINYINIHNIAKIDSEDLLAFPNIYKIGNKVVNEQKLNTNEIIPYLAWQRILDNKHLELIYKELDKPGSVKITKKNIKQFITEDISEYRLAKVFNLK